ncbi:MAG: ABC-F family ATP-binding cassette domain-containing protein [Sulfurospirillaceae bacterium]|nr:ABC-F family ATP-binding cassette domain-containing protein [Sulfurospirillaceae bacterium]
MALLDILEVSKSYESQKILDKVSLSVNKGERICIIGKNGGGKSTLMKIINGSLEIDEGRRILQNQIKVDMLDQTPIFEENLSVKDTISLGLKDLIDAKESYEDILKRLSTDFENKELLKKQDELLSFLDTHDAWNLDDKVERVMQKLNLKEFEDTDINLLSGGEQRRVTLAGLILKKPDILLLDEPTNHLDVYMVEFLEDMLLKEQFTLVFISHDRYFIDHLATKTIEIDNAALMSFNGGYQDYLKAKELMLHSMSKEHENLLKLLKREEEWLRRGVKARLKRNEGRKQRVFDLKEKAKTNPAAINKIKLELEREQKNFNQNTSVNRQKMLFEMYNISKSLGNKKLIENFSTRILQKERIAIVGKNGSGKSTFLKILLQDMKIDSGTLKAGELKIGYFDQQRQMLDDDKDILETFCPNGGDRIDVKGRNLHVFGYLKNFLFPKEHLNKKIGVLSGGEKNRIALALLFTKEVDCLILDEPTNDLDIPTINILEDYILNFQGAVIFVSHDRYFVDKIAKKLFIFKGDGIVEESYQEYSEYLSIEKEIQDLETFSLEERKETGKKDKTESQKPLKLSYKEKKDYDSLPQTIKKLEDDIKSINECLQDPSCYEKLSFADISAELSQKEKELEILIDRFLELEEKAEALS